MVQVIGGDMMVAYSDGKYFLGSLVKYHLNTTAYVSIVANHDGYVQQNNTQRHKAKNISCFLNMTVS